jgi:hypothetical protein
MRESEKRKELAPAWVSEPSFWEGVEREVEALDVVDLGEFLAADAAPVTPRPGFFQELRERLRGLVRSRYST